MEAMGDYALQTPIQTFLTGNRSASGPNPDVARLKGARYVLAAEPDQGNSLSEGLVKQITGGERITARHLNQEPIEFKPVCKFWLQTNHLPNISGTDEGIWRRVHVVPFNVSIPPEERNLQLTNELEEELPGILAWAVKGCLMWRQEGLGKPAAVRDAVEAYQGQNDGVPTFVEERLTVEKGKTLTKREVYDEYNHWATSEGFPTLEHPQLTPRLKKAGLKDGKKKRIGRYWKDVRLQDCCI